ncbi:Zn(II)2Cys6 transcription factor [Aspergillus homomorphus CBS 101889]|uniref:Zn(2)-C6 fungal-type domain-containing protein n=1 Tax=Aspergillus homomorphus (strain CBS 101889) TaxID=1450537 RepID=A0A395HRX0_ASPHC|nr:hypothetical protein BO97DRAFT_471873 [Aspergillus homomorphus CBS 101889]RAL10163.1 hypothetical protein BO97DRAFT_471873 [Aspergillus homomorphus CBS 101889]
MKRARRSTPKVRSGCLTCKARRIKCDETKPTCQRCTHSNRTCEGYLASSDKASGSPATSLSITTYSIPFKVPGSQVDRQLLHFYCCQAAESLSSFSDPTLWTRLILQRCHTQPIIRNALVTLSALYQDHHSRYSDEGNSPTQPSPRNLQLIARSHRQLRMHLSSPQASYEVALICGVIFYAFESLIGQTENAIRHLDQALILFRRYRYQYHLLQQNGRGIGNDIFPHLSSRLARLDIQASIYHDSRPVVLASSEPIRPISELAPHSMPFRDVNHAETLLVDLQARLLQHLLLYLPYKRTPLNDLPPGIFHKRVALDAAFQEYIHSITNVSLAGGSRTAQHILLLRIQAQLFHSVLLENVHAPSVSSPAADADSALSAALSNISALLDGTVTSHRDVDALSARQSDRTERGFTLSTQLIAGLYVVCLKSSDPFNVDAALSLLQDPRLPRRDGLWDADVVTEVVKRLRDTAGSSKETFDHSEGAEGVRPDILI